MLEQTLLVLPSTWPFLFWMKKQLTRVMNSLRIWISSVPHFSIGWDSWHLRPCPRMTPPLLYCCFPLGVFCSQVAQTFLLHLFCIPLVPSWRACLHSLDGGDRIPGRGSPTIYSNPLFSESDSVLWPPLITLG